MKSATKSRSLEDDISRRKSKIEKIRKRNRRKQKAKSFLLRFVILLFILSIGAFISVTVLFKIDTISVEGETRYDKDEIISLSGAKKGDNLFLFSSGEGERAIEKSMPYISSVAIKRKVPSGVVINVAELKPQAQVELDGKYVLIDSKNKVMDLVSDPVEDVCMIKTYGVAQPRPGEQLVFSDGNIGLILKSVINDIRDFGVEDIKMIDVSNPMQILIDYEGRIKIELGAPEDIKSKLEVACNILKNEIKSTDRGRLNVSQAIRDNRTYFTPDYLC